MRCCANVNAGEVKKVRRKKMKRVRRMLAMMLAVVMVVGMQSAVVLADEEIGTMGTEANVGEETGEVTVNEDNVEPENVENGLENVGQENAEVGLDMTGNEESNGNVENELIETHMPDIPASEKEKATQGEKANVKFVAENEIERKQLTDEDSQAVMEAIGASDGSNEAIIVPATFTVFADWNESVLQMDDIWRSDITAIWFERDDNGKLYVACSGGGTYCLGKDSEGNRTVDVMEGIGVVGIGGDVMIEEIVWNFFHSDTTFAEQKTFELADVMPDMILFQAWYDPTEFDETGNWARGMWTGTAFFVDKEESVFHFQDDVVVNPPLQENTGLNIVLDVTDKVYLIGSGGDATIKCTGELKDFVNVAVDGQLVDLSCYTVSEGSTVLTFLSSYLDTLSVGDHVVTLNYTYGSIDTTLTILDRNGDKTNSNDENIQDDANNAKSNIVNGVPKTGDNTWAAVWMSATMIAGCGWFALVCTIRGRKRGKRG